MRVLLTTDTVGGVWTYAVELARAVEPLGIDIALATMGGPLSDDQRRQVRPLRNVALFEGGHRLEWMHDPWSDVRRAGDWLMTIEQSFEPDVVHLNGFAHGQWPLAAPKLVVGHSCVCSWFEAVKGEPAPSPQWARYRSEVWAGLHAADRVVAPSAAMLAALDRHYGPLPRATVIYNGRDPSRYRPGDKEDFVLTAGRLWDEAKNLAALDRVAVELPCAVCVAGDDRHPDADASGGGGGGRVPANHLVMLGRLDEAAMAGWLSRASVYALPARYEPFGLSVLEAALSGCALVLGDIPSLRELWDGAAAFVDPGDAAGLAATLRRVAGDKAERRRLSDAAPERAARYSSAAMARAYADLYTRLIHEACQSRAVSARTDRRSVPNPRDVDARGARTYGPPGAARPGSDDAWESDADGPAGTAAAAAAAAARTALAGSNVA